MNPFVRFARQSEYAFSKNSCIACDHRIFYCKRGSLNIYINDVKYSFSSGDVIYWPSGYTYRFLHNENSAITGCNFDFTQKNADLSSPIIPIVTSGPKQKIDVLEKITFSDTDIFNAPLLVKNAYVLKDVFQEIADEYDREQLYYRQKISSLLKSILTDCMRFHNMKQQSKSISLVQEVLSYIRNNYSHDITNKKIGEQFRYHPNYLNSLVIRYTGKSMHRYLLEYRVNTAINLLQFESVSVSEAGAMVGLPDIKHFSKVFKSVVGIPPSQFKL